MLKIFSCLILPFFMISLLPASLFAQDDESALEMLVLSEIPVSVASLEVEPLKETPVIISVVTDNEIKRMGARTLHDVLMTLPGFSFVQDHNELFSAHRGIYASSQQKILILRDGHRLNSRSYSEANDSHAISLANVKMIEIMRGPGASLYGDVALTAVINLVSRTGEEINGVEFIVGAGNYGQKKADLVYGANLGQERDISLFGSFYESKGQKRNWQDPRDVTVMGEGIVYGFTDKPAYDFGFNFKMSEKWRFLFEKRYENYIEPASGGGITGEIYDYDSFPKFDRNGPGLNSEFNHTALEYKSIIWDDYTFLTRVYFDTFELGANLISKPSNSTNMDLFWEDRDFGTQATMTKKYICNNYEGSLLIGGQLDFMEVTQSSLLVNTASVVSQAARPLEPGKEKIYSVFAQIKHHFNDQLLTNIGVRYDYKYRKPLPGVNDQKNFSPRAALIYQPNNRLTFRLNYSQAFVDAPYWYRNNNLASYQGASDLKPEIMNSTQFSISDTAENGLFNRLNLFLNNFSDVIFRTTNGDVQYDNAGEIKSRGAEYEIGYTKEYISARVNYTYQKVIESKGYMEKNGKLENIPQHMANLVFDIAPFYGVLSDVGKNLWVNVTVIYRGNQYARWGKTLAGARDDVDSSTVCNLGVRLDNITNGFSLGVHVYNAFDKTYYQGGSVEYPYLQPGRFYLIEVGRKW